MKGHDPDLAAAIGTKNDVENPPLSRSLDELEAEIAELSAYIDAATYQLLRSLWEFDRLGGWESMGFSSCAHWLSWRTGMDMITAREKVRVARALNGLPIMSKAFRQGRVSYSKVRAMSRIATPENEEEIMRIARDGTAAHVESVVKAYRRAERGEEAEEAKLRHEERYLQVYTDNEGMVVIEGRLPPEAGACLMKALDAAMDALRARDVVVKRDIHVRDEVGGDGGRHGKSERRKGRGERRKGKGERRKGRAGGECEAKEGGGIHEPDVWENRDQDNSAESLGRRFPREKDNSAESLEGKAAHNEDDSAELLEMRETGCEEGSGELYKMSTVRCEDDSAELFEMSVAPYEDDSAELSKSGSLACEDDSAESCVQVLDLAQLRADALGLIAEAALGKGLGHGERGEAYQVVVHVDAEVLADPGREGAAELESGQRISAETCRRLACDSPFYTIAHGAKGQPINLGRKTRKISAPLWRILKTRDRTCQFPGCNRTRHLQAHHIEHWAAQGETNPDNLVLLCRAHHWAVHEGGFEIRGRAPRELVFVRPDGRRLLRVPPPVLIAGHPVEELKSSLYDLDLRITPDTNVCGWDGEAMDLDMAVTGLLDVESESGASV